MVKNTVVISAFPACGKSYMVNNNDTEYTLIDSDSTVYSWIWKDGKKTNERNPNFIRDYIQHIKDNIGKVDVIFVSSHKDVRKALRDENIKYFVVYPSVEMKDTMLKRMEDRGNTEEFIKLQRDNMEQFIQEVKNEKEQDIKEHPFNKDTMMRNLSFHEIELSEKMPYINKDLIYRLLDNSMGNLSICYLNNTSILGDSNNETNSY